jgi:hypothetical protein
MNEYTKDFLKRAREANAEFMESWNDPERFTFAKLFEKIRSATPAEGFIYHQPGWVVRTFVNAKGKKYQRYVYEGSENK